jgi:hypothetical protein
MEEFENNDSGQSSPDMIISLSEIKPDVPEMNSFDTDLKTTGMHIGSLFRKVRKTRSYKLNSVTDSE